MVLSGRVLSIQSSVVSGYVGNKSAVFPLQLLGFHVDVINSVQFSNHTGYENGWTGQKLSGEELVELVQGMEKNNLLSQITHLLTGYAGSSSFLRALIKVYKILRQSNPNIQFVCDPVLGDDGKFYVAREMLDVYRFEVVPLANVLTPNAFELGVLCGRGDDWGSSVKSPSEIFAACSDLHACGVKIIVVTSSVSTTKDKIVAYCSKIIEGTSDHERYVFEMDKVANCFTGSGDLTAALLLAHLSRRNFESVESGCAAAFATANEIMQRTHQAGEKDVASGRLCKASELELIGSQDAILHPPMDRVRSRLWTEAES